MPYATNPVDGVRTYFEDSGAAGPPVLFYTGFADPLEVAKSSRLARALGGHHPGILVIREDNDRKRDLRLGGVVRAIQNLLASGMAIENGYFILNHWR